MNRSDYIAGLCCSLAVGSLLYNKLLSQIDKSWFNIVIGSTLVTLTAFNTICLITTLL
jgi:hypothetical protein